MSSTPWVGWFRAAEAARFVRLEQGEDGHWLASVPALGWFRTPAGVRHEGDELAVEFAVPLAGIGGVRLAGKAGSGTVAGVAQCGGRAGDFELWAAAPFDEAAYRPYIARFAGGGRSVSLHLQSDSFFGAPVPLYLEGDHLVRLHAISPGRFVSERAELIEVGAGGARPGITVREQPRAAAVRLARATSWHEEDVTFPGAAGALGGTVMTPASGSPRGAIALVHGAGSSTRDFYRIFGEQFTEAGLAALIYDKRGHGRSEGSAAASSMLGRSRDAEAALDFLGSRPGIPSGMAGLYGFSNGAWSVPMVSGRRGDLAFVVVMGAPGVTPARSEVHRKTFELREQGVPEEECRLVATMWGIIYQFRSTHGLSESDSMTFDDAAERLSNSAALASVKLQQYAIDNPGLSPIPPYRSHLELLAAPGDADDEEMSYDPVPDYYRTTCPVLFTVGDRDENLPAAESVERVAPALRVTESSGSLLRVFPDAGHMMNVSEPAALHGMTTEEASYQFHRFRFAPGFLEILRSWTAGQVHRSSSAATRSRSSR